MVRNTIFLISLILVLTLAFAPYAIAGAVILLLFTGIADAWDTVDHRQSREGCTDDGGS